jgi:hypothetical protein
MSTYLSEHPDIFMPRRDIHFFGSDLAFQNTPRLTLDQYLALFASSEGARYRFDAATWRLYSKFAATEIYDASPEARILIMLRDPADAMYSWHSLAYNRLFAETLPDFRAAVAEEARRAQGSGVPATAHSEDALFYRRLYRYPEQVSRYLDTFGRSQVHFCIFEELSADPRKEYLAVLGFLGLPDDRRRAFAVINQESHPRSRPLAHLLDLPSANTRRFVRRLLPDQRKRRALRSAIVSLNTAKSARKPLEQEFRQELARSLLPEVEALEALLDRRLPWLQDLRSS